MLAARVAAGDLSEPADRMPANPFVIRPSRHIGIYGGELRLVGFPEAGSYFTGFTASMQVNLFTGEPTAGPDPNKYNLPLR